jgi:hypothetical protein
MPGLWYCFCGADAALACQRGRRCGQQAGGTRYAERSLSIVVVLLPRAAARLQQVFAIAGSCSPAFCKSRRALVCLDTEPDFGSADGQAGQARS